MLRQLKLDLVLVWIWLCETPVRTHDPLRPTHRLYSQIVNRFAKMTNDTPNLMKVLQRVYLAKRLNRPENFCWRDQTADPKNIVIEPIAKSTKKL